MTDPAQAGKPLAGKRVVVARAREQSAELVERLEALGAEVIAFPTIEIRRVEIDTRSLGAFDWVVFTSANGVTHFSDQAHRDRVSIDLMAHAKAAVVGSSTAQRARDAGWTVELVADEQHAEGLLETFHRLRIALDGKRVLLPKGDLARSTLSAGLSKRGADVVDVIVYETTSPAIDPAKADALVAQHPDAVVFTSSSTVQNLAGLLGATRLKAIESTAVFVSIGPKTTETLHELGLKRVVQPQHYSTAHLMESVIEALSGGYDRREKS